MRQPSLTANQWVPGPLTMHAIVMAALLFAATLAKGPWDSDFYWHRLTGRLIAEGQFPRTDPFSFTWAGMPWTLHEWLSELIIYRLVDGLGYVGAVIVFGLVPGAVVAILVFGLHRSGLRTAAIIGSTVVVAILVIPYVTIRPQVLSWVMLAALVGGLIHLAPNRRRWTLLVVPFFALWANLHGLWVVGLGVLVLYGALSIVGLTPMSLAKRWSVALVALALIGVMFTPEGPPLVLYPLRYVDGADWGMANITEWQSPDFHDPAHIPLLIYLGALAIFGRWKVPWWMSILAFIGVAMTLVALRNGPVTAILGTPALAFGMDRALRDWRPSERAVSPRVARRRRVMEAVMAAVVVIAGVLIFIPANVSGRIEASVERELPVQGVAMLQTEVPSGRILAEYGWGGYVIGQMYELGARVMVDGRNDMYDDAILTEYTKVQNADPGWDEIADHYQVDALLFPPYRAITKGPAEEAGWCEAFRDENEVLYLRSCSP
jgi:hypothetical protein